MSAAVIIVAAGRGSRAGGDIPKQYCDLGGRSVLARSCEAFLSHEEIASVLVVIHPDDTVLYEQALEGLPSPVLRKLLPAVAGGETRQNSVRQGLEALVDARPQIVLIHDAARPWVDRALIDRALQTAQCTGAAVPGIPVTDTIKIVGEEGYVVDTPDRARLRAVQTPQAFRYDQILKAHRDAAAAGLSSFTDDGALAEWAGLKVHVFGGSPQNAKITHAADLQDAERRLRGADMTYVTRLGTGFDVHAFGEGDHVWLGGVRIAHDKGVLAHSDGDVVLHALTDALLGAIADGDIGVHFPPSDPQWRGASSDRFLAFAAERVRLRDGVIDHLDVTLLCEAPRLSPHREEMRRRIAQLAGLRIDQVSLKATTTEKLGFTGRQEGLAAQAAATVRLPEQSG
jgi:2-C-methyl-D-erythritol 4-phosphate cytidylyltransferase / 2-C-methyl-D-erythritol 2,4-cyclodiphosphate synthase